MNQSSMGLRKRLLLLTLLALIPAIIQIGYTAFTQRRQATALAEESAAHLVQLAVREQKLLVATTHQLLLSMSQLYAIKQANNGSDCSEVLAELHKANPHYTNFGVARLNGEVICSAVPLHDPVNIADRGYFKRAIQTRGLGIGSYQTGRITGINAINFGYPVFSDTGDMQAVIYAAADLSWLDELIADIALPEGSTLSVIDMEGTILAHYPRAEGWVGKSIRNTSLFTTMFNNSQEGKARLTEPEGTQALYAFAPLTKGPSGTVYASVGVPENGALANVRDGLTYSAISLLIVVVLVMTIAWMGADILVLRPINALARSARQLAKGELNVRTGLPHGNDELGQLAGTFDDMASALQRVNRALRTLSAGNHSLVRSNDEPGLLNSVCRIIVDVGGYACAVIYFVEKNELNLLRPVAQNGFDNAQGDFTNIIMFTQLESWRNYDPAAAAGRTGTTCSVKNIPLASDPSPWHQEMHQRGYTAAAAFPLVIDYKVIGVLSIYSTEADAFDAEELDLLGETAEDLAFGIGSLRTRAEKERATATLAHMAYYDVLTNIPNRFLLKERLQTALDAQKESIHPLALITLNITNLSEINNVLGHEGGNGVLKEVAKRLLGSLPESDTVARLDGDEFALLLVNVGADNIDTMINRIRELLVDPIMVEDVLLEAEIIMGAACYPDHGDTAELLLRRSSIALHTAKREAADFSIYKPESNPHSLQKLTLISELRQAVGKDKLALHYHPQLDIKKGEIKSAEALARWPHPSEGMIAPNYFIPMVEQSGLIRPFTLWVLSEAVAQIKYWSQNQIDLSVAVNLSTRNLLDPGLPEAVEKILTAHDVNPINLTLEVTESAFMSRPENALKVLIALHDMGCKLSIDDYGTGYSSLVYLKKLPVDELKIDQSFVFDLWENEENVMIVRSTIDLAHDMGLKVIAEGVDDSRNLAILSSFNCDIAQGYLLSQPKPATDFEQWLKSVPWKSGRNTELTTT